MTVSKENILDALKRVFYPDQEKDIVEGAMVSNVDVHGDHAHIFITLPANSPFVGGIRKACNQVLTEVFGKEFKADLQIGTKIPEKQQGPHPLKDGEVFPHVKHIVAISSGKGGVGKSTVAVNLSVALAKKGFKVGLLDADVYGPSVPKMFHLENFTPKVSGEDATKAIVIPPEQYGVKLLSIGFFVQPDSPLVWRGPMATSAIRQLIVDAAWGELDYMLIDLPPGTSDIHLTLVQTVAITGAIIVSTPQDVALLDVQKGIAMFRDEKINVPVLGLVENMAWFTPDELPDNKYYIFGKDGCQKLADKYNVPLLGQIPLVQSIREGGDSGTPAALDEHSIIGKAFADLADKLVDRVNHRLINVAPTKKVEMQR